MVRLDSPLRAVSQILLTSTNRLTKDLSLPTGSNSKCPSNTLRTLFSLIHIQRKSTDISRCYGIPFCCLRGIRRDGSSFGTPLQKRGLRLGPQGSASYPKRILQKNEQEMGAVLNLYRGLRSDPQGSVSYPKRVLRKNEQEMGVVLNEYSDRIERLAYIMRCPISQVSWMVSKDTRIVTSFSQTKMETIINLLLGYGFSADSIIRCQSVFCWNISTLKQRVEGLIPYRKYEFSLLHAVQPERTYHKILEGLAKEVDLMGHHPSRLSFLADLLDCTEEAINEGIASGHRHLVTYKLTRLKHLVEVLKEYGFTNEDLLNNLHALQFDPLVSKTRLNQMTASGFFSKEKMLHVLGQSKFIYPTMFKNHLLDAKALEDHKDKYAYLESRLKCSADEIKQLVVRAPAIKNLTPRRLKENLDILLDEFEFQPKMILRNYHLMFFSTKRLRSRWNILSNFNLTYEQIIMDLILKETKFKGKYREFLKCKNKNNLS